MFELWARKRPIDGKGFPYEFIFNFNDESYKYTAIDTLDRSIYQEALIVRSVDHSCVMYSEFEKPMVLRKNNRHYKCKKYLEDEWSWQNLFSKSN